MAYHPIQPDIKSVQCWDWYFPPASTPLPGAPQPFCMLSSFAANLYPLPCQLHVLLDLPPSNENNFSIILLSSQQWTPGPGWAADFPASPHSATLPFAALTLLQTPGKAGLIWILGDFFFCHADTISSPSHLQ